MAEDFTQIADLIKQAVLKTNMANATSATAATNIPTTDLSKMMANTTNSHIANMKVMKDGFSQGTSALSKFFTGDMIGGALSLKDVFLKVITSFSNIIEGTVNLLANGLNKANKLWFVGFNSGIDGSLKEMKNTMIEASGLSKGPMGAAISSFLDNVLQSMRFRFEEGLKWREVRTQGAAQEGFGSKAADQFASSSQKWSGLLGRDLAAAWGKSFAQIGVTSGKTEGARDRMMGVGTQMGMDAGASAKALEDYMIAGNDANNAVTKMEENFRKLQAAAKESGLPVGQMSKFVTAAGTAARFLNVDISTVGNTMAGLMKQSANLGAFGIDMRQQGGDILKEFASGGKLDDAKHVYFGTNRGTENIGVGEAWAKSRFGGSQIEKTAAGGFTGAKTGANDMMISRLDMMKQTMEEASAYASSDAEALMIQTKLAKETFGMSDAAALTLATQSRDGIKDLASNPTLAAEFKSTGQILGEMQNMAAKDQQLQRMLADLNMKQLNVLVKTPQLTGLALKAAFSEDKEDKAKAQAELGTITGELATDMLGSIEGMADLMVKTYGGDPASKALLEFIRNAKNETNSFTLKQGGTVKGSTGAPAYSMDSGILNYKVPGSKDEIKKAYGGDVLANTAYQGGEQGKMELLRSGGKQYFIPPDNGSVVPNFALSKDNINKGSNTGISELVASFSGMMNRFPQETKSTPTNNNNNSSGVNINLAVSGATKQQIIDGVITELDRMYISQS